MPTVLVVDDSALDRRLVGGILQSDAVLTVEYAENGKEALERIEQSAPDLVVTDLQMPEMDGLELVSAVKERHPHVPVILITAHGSETLAIEALERGAASYVPKSQIAKKLLDTVEQTLSLPVADMDFDPLFSRVAGVDLHFNLDNDKALIEPLVGLVKRVLDEFRLCDENARIRIGVAVEEALLNAIFRGNLEISAEDMEGERERLLQGDGRGLVNERRMQSPYKDRRVFLHLQASPEEARIVIRDEGPGFEVERVIDPGDPTELVDQSGRGLVLIRTFMDDVYYNDAGNEITLVKRQDCNESESDEDAERPSG